jgi:hypothetical protein
MILVVGRVAKLPRGFGKEYGFAEVIRTVAEGVRAVGWSGSVSMKGEGAGFRVKSLLLVMKQNFMAKQLRLEIMKSSLYVT